MTTAERVEEDLIAALRARDSTRLATLRLLKSAAKNAEVTKQDRLTEDEYQAIVRRQVKMRREAASEYERGNRPEQAEQERAELAILGEYLPAQLDAEALAALVSQAIAQTGASGPGDLGKVMSQAMKAASGRADGTQVRELARTLLTERAG